MHASHQTEDDSYIELCSRGYCFCLGCLKFHSPEDISKHQVTLSIFYSTKYIPFNFIQIGICS